VNKKSSFRKGGGEDDAHCSARDETAIGGLDVIDIATGKPITFQDIKAILTWFLKEIDNPEALLPDSKPTGNSAHRKIRIGATMIASKAGELNNMLS
jgi:hypothetical protein